MFPRQLFFKKKITHPLNTRLLFTGETCPPPPTSQLISENKRVSNVIKINSKKRILNAYYVGNSTASD